MNIVSLISKGCVRITPNNFSSKEEYLLYLRHVFVYKFAKDKIPQNNLILEVGCGEGYGASLLSQTARKLIGLDIDKDTILHARHKYGTKTCIFKTYNGVNIPFKDSTFDAVVSFQVIEHIKDDNLFVSEIYRVLKKKGIFILTTPNKTYRLRPNQKPWNKFHIREYYSHELKSLLKQHFSKVAIWGIIGNDEIQRIETERVRHISNDLSLHSLNLINLFALLKSLTKRILNKVTCVFNKPHIQIFLNSYFLSDYCVIKTNVDNCLDLLSLCKK